LEAPVQFLSIKISTNEDEPETRARIHGMHQKTPCNAAMLSYAGILRLTTNNETFRYTTLHQAEPKASCNLSHPSHIIDMSSLQSQMMLQQGSARDLLIRSSPPQSFCGCPPKIMWMPDLVLFQIFTDTFSIRFMLPSLNM
jgi:hypothetical protein